MSRPRITADRPPDGHLLSRCLRRHPDDDLRSELCQNDSESWSRLVDLAIWHGVAPLLHHRLGYFQTLATAPEQHSRLRDLYLHTLLKNTMILEQLREIVAETTKAGYSILFLKGAYLANCVYDDPALRPMNDIDVLAPSSDIDEIQRHLETLGYHYSDASERVDFYHLRPVSRVGSVDVELHRDLAPDGAPFEHDIAGLWHRSTRTRVGDLDLPHPAPDDVLLHVCAHAAYNHVFERGLSAACDIDEMVHRLGSGLDWIRLVRTANADGRARYAYVALRLAEVLLETPIPPAVLASLDHDKRDDEVMEEAIAYVLSTEGGMPDTLRLTEDAPTPGAKLKKLWRGIFPPRATLRRIYGLDPGSRLELFYYVVRPLDLLRRRGRQVLGLVVRSRRSRPMLEKERRRRAVQAWVRGNGR